MSKIEEYRHKLKTIDNWEPFLLEHSGLPGPRGNIDLGKAAAIEGNESLFRRWLEFDADLAPTNTPGEFLAFCGVLGLGRLLAEGRRDTLTEIRRAAVDPRWRVREAAAMALQTWGDADLTALHVEMATWAQGNLLERRAVVAALCEPRLLKDLDHAVDTLHLLDRITGDILNLTDRKSEAFRVLRQTLGYGWSVAAAAAPEAGKRYIAGFFDVADRDIVWIMKENLKKKRLIRMDENWVNHARLQLESIRFA